MTTHNRKDHHSTRNHCDHPPNLTRQHPQPLPYSLRPSSPPQPPLVQGTAHSAPAAAGRPCASTLVHLCRRRVLFAHRADCAPTGACARTQVHQTKGQRRAPG
eukprot:365934-Chlamydomonas_euryale.AAC.11